MGIMQVSKLDGATRQLRTAVLMFLHNQDPVSIHTLGCAAQEVLESIGKGQNVKSLKQTVVEQVRPEKKKYFVKTLDEAKNSFKHAGRDPNASVRFNTESNDLLLWDATILYKKITGQDDPLFLTLNMWIYVKYPDLIVLTSEQRKLFNSIAGKLDPNNRTQFLEYIPMFEKAMQG